MIGKRMLSRHDAVEYLRRKGFHAHSRDWNFGETILVATDYVHVPKGISYYERALYIYPKEDYWAIYDPFVTEEHPTCSALQDAVFEAERRLQ